ncbi:hypothetical protein KGA66_26090 [Actinocrinis puniceicyclus]|uniref:SAF domain-containing protein n=1 Tax=Actinocrinis puniceicyclus TaxID=977794 RepID=A0A8J7WU60_9ACTN|nr:SAF domain-containing protein [Actinocrinis puniceicyclus]MBS2966537.1 hypothetical protein [Actinocrinis puniceicyclus]
MNPYTKDTIPSAGGYVPAPMPAPPRTKKRPRRFAAWFRTAGRARYLVAAAIAGIGALTVPVLVHTLASPRQEVLKAARDLSAGHVITKGDLGSAPGDGSSGSIVPASRAAALIGQRLRVEVPSGALLAPGDLGSYPPAGTTLVPVAVKAGQYAPNLEAGDQVAVFPTAGVNGTSTQPAAHAAATGRVVQIQAQSDSANGTVVVLLATSTSQAPVIAQAPSVVLVTLDGEGDAP